MTTPADLTGAPVHPCCADPANRELVGRRGDFTHRRCRVCGRNHYELEADPGALGVRGATLGPPPAG